MTYDNYDNCNKCDKRIDTDTALWLSVPTEPGYTGVTFFFCNERCLLDWLLSETPAGKAVDIGAMCQACEGMGGPQQSQVDAVCAKLLRGFERR